MSISRLMEGGGAYSLQDFMRGHLWAFLSVLKGCFTPLWRNETVCKLVLLFIKSLRGKCNCVCTLSASSIFIITHCDLQYLVSNYFREND